jgi:hypothetical protein
VEVQGKQVDERPAEQQVQEMATGMRRLMHAKPAAVTQFLLDCAVELGHKAPTYAMLLGEGASLLPIHDSRSNEGTAGMS